MDVQTANRIYDEIAVTVGMRLIDIGVTIDAASVEILSTDRERESGVDQACALGRLSLDNGDIEAIVLAVEAQNDRIRSIMSLPVDEDSPLATVHRLDLEDALLRRDLMVAYGRNDRLTMASSFSRMSALQSNPRG